MYLESSRLCRCLAVLVSLNPAGEVLQTMRSTFSFTCNLFETVIILSSFAQIQIVRSEGPGEMLSFCMRFCLRAPWPCWRPCMLQKLDLFQAEVPMQEHSSLCSRRLWMISIVRGVQGSDVISGS